MSMLGSWGNWIAETASSAAKVATETVNEIIAEGKQELGGGGENVKSNKSSSSSSGSSAYCYWDVVKKTNPAGTSTTTTTSAVEAASGSDENEGDNKSVHQQREVAAEIQFPSTSKFWSSNPMQWQCLIKNGVATDVNTFTISPEALIFESHYSPATAQNTRQENEETQNPSEQKEESDADLFEDDGCDGDEKNQKPKQEQQQEEGNIKTIIENILNTNGRKQDFKIEIKTNNNITNDNDNDGNNDDKEDTNNNNKKKPTSSFYSVDIPVSILPTADSIRKMLKEDSLLADLRYDLVPRWVKENDFWRNFAFRVYLLAHTESVEEAMKILEIVNVEHRRAPPPKVKKEKKVEQEQEKGNVTTTGTNNSSSNHQQEQQQHLLLLEQLEKISKTGNVLIKNIETAHQQQRYHSNRSLTNKGYGKLGDAANCHQQTVFFEELKENIQATGETESWQQLFASRASKELESVHSSVSMLEKLIVEVNEYSSSSSSSSKQTAQEDNDTIMTTTAAPSLELIQSIAESCKFHKGRVGALIGELQSAPPARVVGNTRLDPDDGELTGKLKDANARLGKVLVEQGVALKKLSDVITSSLAGGGVAASGMVGRSEEEAEAGNQESNTTRNHDDADAEFVAKMPWEDEE